MTAKSPNLGTRAEIIRLINEAIEANGISTKLIVVKLSSIHCIPALIQKGIEYEYKQAGWQMAMLMGNSDSMGYSDTWEMHLVPPNNGYADDELSSKYDAPVKPCMNGEDHDWQSDWGHLVNTMHCPKCKQIVRKEDDSQ